MADARGSLDTFVVFVAPQEGGSAHDLLDTRDAARAIPDVRVIEDESEAHVFGAATSGQVLLYDEAGKLVFRGGITPARGHEGDSAGGEVVRRFLSARSGRRAADRSVSPHASDVFGCALFDRRTP